MLMFYYQKFDYWPLCFYSELIIFHFLPSGKKINLEVKNVELKIADGTFKIGDIAELEIPNGPSIA